MFNAKLTYRSLMNNDLGQYEKNCPNPLKGLGQFSIRN